jgi:hypothetical protein
LEYDQPDQHQPDVPLRYALCLEKDRSGAAQQLAQVDHSQMQSKGVEHDEGVPLPAHTPVQ